MASTLGPGSLKFGETATAQEFAAMLSNAVLTPSTEADDDVDTLDGGVIAGVDDESWTIGGTIMQNYLQGSLEDWCFKNRSLVVPFIFTPSKAGYRTYSGKCKIRALVVGGDVKARNTADFEFPLVGPPVQGTVPVAV
jgi:hypothetical protein